LRGAEQEKEGSANHIGGADDLSSTSRIGEEKKERAHDKEEGRQAAAAAAQAKESEPPRKSSATDAVSRGRREREKMRVERVRRPAPPAPAGKASFRRVRSPASRGRAVWRDAGQHCGQREERRKRAREKVAEGCECRKRRSKTRSR